MEDFTIQQLRDAMDNLLQHAEAAEKQNDFVLGDCFRMKYDEASMIYLGKVYGEGPYGHLSGVK